MEESSAERLVRVRVVVPDTEDEMEIYDSDEEWPTPSSQEDSLE